MLWSGRTEESFIHSYILFIHCFTDGHHLQWLLPVLAENYFIHFICVHVSFAPICFDIYQCLGKMFSMKTLSKTTILLSFVRAFDDFVQDSNQLPQYLRVILKPSILQLFWMDFFYLLLREWLKDCIVITCRRHKTISRMDLIRYLYNFQSSNVLVNRW